MGDRIDDLMTKLWPQLQKEVSAGLALKPEIDKYLPIDPQKDAKPYRLTSAGWDPAHPIPAILGVGTTASIQRFRTSGAFEGAFELSIRLDLSIDTLEDGEDGLCQTVRNFALGARFFERGAILLRLGDNKPIQTYDEAAIRTAVGRYPGPCRLIVKSKNETADNAKKSGLVDDVVDSESQLPGGVEALLLALYDGPMLRRAVDDLTPTWLRDSNNDGVTICLSERFFLDRRTRAVRLYA